jgi:hypothetical protein
LNFKNIAGEIFPPHLKIKNKILEEFKMRNAISKIWILSVLILLSWGCKDILNVENPNQITDDDLNVDTAIPAIVAGVAADFSIQYEWTIICSGLLSNELIHIGSFPTFREMYLGEVSDENITLNNWFGYSHRARWVAENGIKRIISIVGKDSADKMIEVAMLHIYAGYSNIMIADMWDGTPIDGGPIVPRSEVYDRAINHFTQAINMIGNIPDGATFKNGHQTLDKNTVKAIAYLGRARAKLFKGDLPGAYQDVSDVSMFQDLRFDAVYSENSDRENNLVYIYAYDRPEVAVGPRHQIKGDPRVPVQDPSESGKGYWRQTKYPSRAADIPLAEWQEAALIRAEYFHSQGDISSALAEINSIRNAAGLSDTTVSDLGALLELIKEERKREFFLEGVYLQDLRRFNDPFLQGRMSFFPIPKNEKDANPNI